MTVCDLTGIGARGIDERNDRHGPTGKLPNDFNSSQVMFRHPYAAVATAFLGKDAHASRGVIAEIEKHFDRVEGTDVDFPQDLSAHAANNPAGSRPVRIF